MKNDSPSVSPTAPRPNFLHRGLLLSALAVLLWSGWNPHGRFNWLMEVLPALMGGTMLLATYRRFRLTTLSYVAIWLFALVLMIGGHYTYAEVPIGNWARDAFDLSRNHFDRVGHFLQGVIPALLARELLLRTSPLGPGKWSRFLPICVALAISAAYELFEWRYAVTFGGQQAEDFLGSQGDVWDAQKDMAMALLGSTLAMLLLTRMQDRQLQRLTAK